MEKIDEEYGERERRRLLSHMAELIDESGLTQKEVASMMGVDPSILNKALKGERATSLDYVCRIAAALDLKVELFPMD